MSGSKTVVFITGANTGLGLEVVRALYKSSTAYEIVIGCRSVDKGEAAIKQVQEEISSSSSALSAVQIDITSDDSITRARDSITTRFGRVDVLINNAGANLDGPLLAAGKSLRDVWNATWDVNVAGTQVVTTEFAPLLLQSAAPRLLFVTSGTSSMAETEKTDGPIYARINGSPPAGWPKPAEQTAITCYRSSKTGLNMLMREWTRLLKEDGVKVWCISPGFLATGLGSVGAEQLKKMGAKDPSVGGEFIRAVVEGQHDHNVGKVIREDMIQAW